LLEAGNERSSVCVPDHFLQDRVRNRRGDLQRKYFSRRKRRKVSEATLRILQESITQSRLSGEMDARHSRRALTSFPTIVDLARAWNICQT